MTRASTWLGLLASMMALACGAERGASPGESGAKSSGALLAPAADTAASSAPRTACSLLDDARLRPRLGGALENKLLMQCGRAARTPQLGSPPAAEAAAPPNARALRLAAAAGGTDIPVSDPSLDVGGSTQSETTVVSVGNVVCAAWNDAGEGFGANGFAGFGYSLDGGQTFKDGGPFPAGPSGDQSFGDPSLAYSVRDGAFYMASLSSNGLSMWKSSDSCQSFQYIGPIKGVGGDDKELIAIDNTPTSPFFGRIHVGWTGFGLADDINVANHSDDGGLTWATPVSLPGSGGNGQGVYPAVAPNGDVYMALVNRAFVIGGQQDQWIYRSTDGGVSWEKMADIGTDQLQPEDATATQNCGRQALNGDVRNLSSPQIVVSAESSAPAGYVIHTVYPYDSDGAGLDHSNVFYRRSVDGAQSWSAEVQLNDDGTTTDQFFPAIGVGESGILAVSWYDRRLDATGNLLFDRYLTISTDSGFSWAPNERISDVSSPVAQTNPNFDGLATCYHGDYDQVAVSGNLAHLVWSDDRRTTASGPNPDVYYDQFVVNPRAGRLRATQALVSCSGSVAYALSDSDLSGSGTHTIAVTTSAGDSESLVLTEDPTRLGTFSGSMTTAGGAMVVGNGVLEVSDSDVITATYEDADDGSGTAASVTALVRVDCLPPTLSNIRVSSLSGSAATVSSDASEAAALKVDYGFSCGALNQSVTSKLSATPSAALALLYPGLTYFYAVTATDSVGNSARDDNAGACYTFTTLAILFQEDFEQGLGEFVIDNGASGGGGFGGAGGSSTGGAATGGTGVAGKAPAEIGVGGASDEGGAPSGGSGGTGTGGGGGNAFAGLWHLSDACASRLVGHSATHTVHYGQDSTCTFDNGLTSEGSVTSPVIMLGDAEFATLEFDYFLGTEGGGFYDQASVEVSVNDGPFQVLSGNFTSLVQPDPDKPSPYRTRKDARPAGSYTLVDNSGVWQHASEDLTPLLAGLTQARIQIRFRFATIDSIANQFAGFYVDDVRVLGPAAKVPCASDQECDDGLFCTGTETCREGFCAKGLPVVCTADDGVSCTDAVCDEATQECVQRPNDAKCDDGVFCNGFERCDAGAGCQATSATVCPSGKVDCAVGVCVEYLKACSVTANHAACDDGKFCTGFEYCDLDLGCRNNGPPCEDGIGCTSDVCDELTQSCEFPADDTRCDDGLFCTGKEYCDPGVGCRTSGSACTPAEKCDEGGNQCLPICFTDTNTAHQGAGRAYSRRKQFYALGSNDTLGKSTDTSSLQGSGSYWRRVASCPVPPQVDSVTVSVSGGNVTVSGTASDANGDLASIKVTYWVYFGFPVTLDAVGTQAWSSVATLPVGTHFVQVQAFDRAGFVSALSAAYFVEVLPSQPPSVGPLSVSVNGRDVTISGSATDPNNDIQRIEISILKAGEVIASTVATGTTSFSGTVFGLPAGSYAVRAQAFDSAGLVSLLQEPIPFEITVVTQCISERNQQHVDNGRATVRRGAYYAVGSDDALGRRGTVITSLLGAAGYWERVSSCP